MWQTTLQDTVQLRLSVEDTIINETIRVVVGVEASLQTDHPDDEFRRTVRASLDNLIASGDVEGGDWKFSNMRRMPRAGMEAVTVTASARVPEAESRNLAERTRKLTREGLSFVLQVVDTSLPLRLIVEAEQRMRITLAKKSQEEAIRMSEVLGKTYRVHAIDFDSTLNSANNMVRPNDAHPGLFKVARTPDPGHAAPDDALGNAKKIMMHAKVILAVVVPS